MVVSPPYACQFVLVTKLVAVLNETYWFTSGIPTGSSGRCACVRISTYASTTPIPLNQSTHVAYRRQVCSTVGSTRISR